MAKRRENKSRKPNSIEEERLRAIYEKSRREFSAADLQKFTVVEKGVPLEKVIEKMAKIQKTYKPKKS